MKDYWKKRLEQKQSSIKSAEQFEKESAERLKAGMDAIQEEIKAFVARYAKDQNITYQEAKKSLNGVELEKWRYTLDEWFKMAEDIGYKAVMDKEYVRSRVSRLKALEAQMKVIMGEYAKTEQLALFDLLADTYDDNYYRTIYDLQVENGKFSSNFAHLNRDKIEQAVNADWAGSHFSKRIWDGMADKLPEIISQSVMRGITTGESSEALARRARVVYKNYSQYQWHRLIHTEMAHIVEEATFKAYEKSNLVDAYVVLATLEAHTCEVCGKLDTESYRNPIPLKDKRTGVNYPPLHPNCRCTTVAAEDKDSYDTRWARDPKTEKGYYTKAKTYEEWRASLSEEQNTYMTMRRNEARDKEQFKRYKSILGTKNSPKSFAKFQELKYNDKEGYEQLKQNVRDYKRWSKAEFPTEKSFNGHFEKHKGEFPRRMTKEQYRQKAAELLSQPISDNVLGYDTEWRRVRYDLKTNTFVLGDNKRGRITTMLKPEEGVKYYESDWQREFGNH